MSVGKLARLALIVNAGVGMLAGASLSIDHLKHGDVCPLLGPVPACIVVFLGYLCVFLAALFPARAGAKKLFYAGWIPVFLLALAGVVLEILKGDVCPSGAMGIPQCFYSFGMALVCLLLFQTIKKPFVPRV